ncbi:MAG: hypothetical protein M0Q93_00045 [Terrimicrobiaceae bacterium]|nr:hypothetical protein [Terrimicrobiaceae bacterium]
MRPHAAVDFESTFFPKRKIGLRTMGVDQYLWHHEVEIYLCSVQVDGGSFVGHPSEFDWSQIADLDWESHNAGFDRRVWRRFLHDYPENAIHTPKTWTCTANLTSWMGYPRDLKGAVSALFNVDISKDARKKMENKTVAELRNGPDWKEIIAYAERDAEWCYKLWDTFSDSWPDIEKRISDMTTAQVLRGLPADEEYIDASIAKLERVCWEAKKALPWANGTSEDKAVLSPIALAEECRKIGIVAPTSLAEDDADCQRWEREHLDLGYVQEMRRWRKANLLKTKFTAMKNRISPATGRIDFSQKYCGSHTKRASGDQGFNVFGFQREPFPCKTLVEGQTVWDLPVADRIDMRRAIHAGSDGILCCADLAQIEPRTTAWVTHDQAKIDLINSGLSVYQVHAIQTLHWRGENLKKEDPDKYALCKMRVLGLSYGCGWKRFIDYCWEQFGHLISTKDSRYQVNDFRRKERKIVQLWNRLGNLLEGSLGDDIEIELPSWNVMRYRDLRKSKGQIAAVLATGRINRLWGSLLCENMIQAIARDAFYEKMLMIEDAGIPTLFCVHDEGITDGIHKSQGQEALEIVTEIMRAPCEWMPGIALDSEAFLSPFYKK